MLTPTKPSHTEWIIFKYDEWVLTQMVRKPANYWSYARHGTEIVRGASRPSPRPPHLPTYRARREPHEHHYAAERNRCQGNISAATPSHAPCTPKTTRASLRCVKVTSSASLYALVVY